METSLNDSTKSHHTIGMKESSQEDLQQTSVGHGQTHGLKRKLKSVGRNNIDADASGTCP